MPQFDLCGVFLQMLLILLCVIFILMLHSIYLFSLLYDKKIFERNVISIYLLRYLIFFFLNPSFYKIRDLFQIQKSYYPLVRWAKKLQYSLKRILFQLYNSILFCLLC